MTDITGFKYTVFKHSSILQLKLCKEVSSTNDNTET